MQPRRNFQKNTNLFRRFKASPCGAVQFVMATFVIFSLFSAGGWWLLLLLPALFFMSKAAQQNNASCATSWDDMNPKRKNNEKSKRRFIETPDGDVLEVIDEPLQV